MKEIDPTEYHTVTIDGKYIHAIYTHNRYVYIHTMDKDKSHRINVSCTQGKIKDGLPTKKWTNLTAY